MAVDEYNSSKPTIAATDNEIKVADFMNSLFESPLYTDLENTMDLLKEQGELKSQYYHASTEEIIQIVAEKFTYEEFSSLVKQYHSLDDIGPINPTYIAVSDFGPLMKFHCLTCEKDFYADPYSLKIGTLCPACAAKMSDMDLLARYVSLHGDEKYKLLSISDHNTMEVLHEPCGVITHPNIQQFIWNDSKCHFCARVSNDEWQKRIDPDVKEFKILSRKVSSGIGRLIVDHINSGHAPFEIADDKMLDRPHCPLCESSGGNLRNYTEEDGIIRFTSNSIESNIVKEARAKHVGQANYASNGQRMEIIEYHNSKDVTVQFEDGTIRSGIALAAFMRGKVKNPNKLVETKKDRTGEEMVSRAGQKMVIVEYRKSSDIDVKFEDGTVVEHQRYPNFLSGDIINPSVEYKGNRLTERLGEIGIMKNGQSCKIVVYYSSKNMDVEFEDGTIAHNVYYSDFKRGNVKNPSTDRIINRRKKDVVGETNVAKNGMLITIIAAPDQNDLTIQFEDGFIAEHVSWKRFKAGSVLRPDCNYH